MNDLVVHIVDDDEAVRDAIEMLLDSVDIPCRTHSGGQAFLDDKDAEQNCGCIVLDIRMPGMSGLELQQRLKELGRAAPIIFITGHGDIPMAVEAMRQGALDFIRKPFRDQDLIDRINEALTAHRENQDKQQDVAAVEARLESLTPRELEVFGRVARGQANKVIALDLGISERTVEIHRSQVMKKTESRTLADLVRIQVALEQHTSPT